MRSRKMMSAPPLPLDLDPQFGTRCSSSESMSDSYSLQAPSKSPSRSGDFCQKSISDVACGDLRAGHNRHRKEMSTNASASNHHHSHRKLYLFIEINDERIPIRTNSCNSVKQIFEQLMIHRRISSRRAWGVFIHKATNKLLHPYTSLAEQAVSDMSTLRLLQKQPNTKLNPPGSGSGSSPCSQQKPHKLTFICSFGAPYNEKKITLPYYRNVSLDKYAAKIKQHFAVAADMLITFNFRGTACLGEARRCGIAQLDIFPGDKVHAESMGIMLTLKHYQFPENIKLIQMYRDFSYAMLIEQIKRELRISQDDITALIGKGFNVIDSDSKCKEITEYQTITILTRCDCLHCEHEPTIEEEAAALPTLPLYDAGPMYIEQTQALHMRPNDEFLLQRCPPGYENPNAYFFYDPFPNYDYLYEKQPAGQAPSVQQHYYHHEVDTKDARELLPPLTKHKGINGRMIIEKSLKPIPKLCRYGADCRYFKNPHISGPCWYYHPPSEPPHIVWLHQ